MSIQWRIILVLNFLVLGLAGVQAYIARETAARVVEEQLAWQMSAGVSAFLQNQSFPLNDRMMLYLRDIFHTHWVVTQPDGDIAGSSLSPEATRAFRAWLATQPSGHHITLAGELHQVASKAISRRDAATGDVLSHTLFVLVPDAQLDPARTRAVSRMRAVFIPSAIVVTVVASLLSLTITRPIRRLANRMDATAQAPRGGAGEAGGSMTSAKDLPGSGEVAVLSRSFDRLVARLEQAQQALAQHERLATLGKVSMSVAHEIRNPLSGIQMNVRVLKDELAGLPSEAGIDVILREIERIDLYLQELMTLSSASGGQAGPASRVRMSELCESVLAILAGRCRHAKIDVRREIQEEGAEILVEPGAMRRGIMNLMVNAIEAMPGGGALRVAITTTPEHVRLAIGDSGEGVRCEPGQDVFDAFTSTKPNSAGLGLYLARQTVQSAGGRIGYDNGPAGATFWVELPRATGAALEAQRL